MLTTKTSFTRDWFLALQPTQNEVLAVVEGWVCPWVQQCPERAGCPGSMVLVARDTWPCIFSQAEKMKPVVVLDDCTQQFVSQLKMPWNTWMRFCRDLSYWQERCSDLLGLLVFIECPYWMLQWGKIGYHFDKYGWWSTRGKKQAELAKVIKHNKRQAVFTWPDISIEPQRVIHAAHMASQEAAIEKKQSWKLTLEIKEKAIENILIFSLVFFLTWKMIVD